MKFRFTLTCCYCGTYVLLKERRLPEGWSFRQEVGPRTPCSQHQGPHQPIYCPTHKNPPFIIHDEGGEPEEEERAPVAGDMVFFVVSSCLQRGIYMEPHPEQWGWHWVRVEGEPTLISSRSMRR